ncbi:penicillin-binding protein 1A [Colwellia chukchiensis]|uniref:Penicillin-binding protein 1A n=1 Tax=Colwellia chukchiensis TaxID=641665 RepID=A0A1H7PU98_9GAMM|nr:PBP1A family penicillin-binding protein [Colwellia chukchiensis]SEL38815.1 penicillin-binding protein 1A [Colwellia chukchiensis]
MFIGLLVLAGIYLSMRSNLPSVESLRDLQWQTPMQIFSADGKLISQFGEKKRIPLTLEEMPQQLINAILATEDDRFYLHFGVDPIGMGRAILGQIIGQNKGGASTITMQVARNFFLTREQTYVRKIREIFISFHIESLLTKDEILTLYMNKISLGHRSFGFGAAAQVYYGKDVKDLTLAQIAVLAGLPKAPSTLNPISRPDRAKQRRAVVLQRMFSAGYITAQQLSDANNAPISAKKHGAEIELSAPYIAEMAHQEMIDRFGKETAYTGGFKVFTTVTSHLQHAAQQALINNILAYDIRHGYRGALASLRSVNEESITTKEANNQADLIPITTEEAIAALSSWPSYHHLEPAVVTAVFEQTADITLKNGSNATLDWSALSWARAYINDDKQGPAPTSANEILALGDVIMVAKTTSGYRLSQVPDVSAALVSLNTDNGAIKAAVGGFSFQQSQFNRVTQAKRQVGSNIKPFIYSAALANGYTLASIVNDAPINQWDRSTGVVWRPKNSPPVYSGEIRLRLALAQSKNVIAVRLLRAVGLDNIIPYLALFGFNPHDLPRNESLALGSASLTPLEVATGFATFANGGFLVTPYLIERIEDSFGNIIFQANPAIACDECNTGEAEPTALLQADTMSKDVDNFEAALTNNTINKAPRVISAQNAFLMTEALNSAIWGADWNIKPYWQGTGFRARSLNRRDIAGKTGTTNQAKDAWFSGYSRRLVTTSWIGFDDPSRNLGQTSYNANLGKQQTTGKEFGAKSAQPAWINFMKVALADLPIEPFTQPDALLSVRIDKASGKLTTKTDRSSRFEYFELGTAPTEYVSQDLSSEILDGGNTEENSELEIFD